MKIAFDPAKRDATLKERDLDFADVEEMFAGEIVFEAEDDRRDYGESRIITVGFLRGPDGRRRVDVAGLDPPRFHDAKGKRP